jgi:ADP-heptose:LPS heptosyltransferase
MMRNIQSTKLMTKRILILSHDNKIGDAIVVTGLFKPLHSLWPDCEIGVLCGGSNAALYRHHPDVKWLHVAQSRNVFARIWASLQARFKRYDLVVHFGLDLANPSVQIVLNTVRAKQRFLFLPHPTQALPNDVVMLGDWGYSSDHETLHYSARHVRFLQTLGAQVETYRYDIHLVTDVTTQMPRADGPLMVINSQSSAANKSFSLPWLESFVQAVYAQYPHMRMQLLSASPALETAMQAMFAAHADRVYVTPFAPTVTPSLAAIQEADLVVTPDTYAVHAASAWNKPVLALYEPSVLSVQSWEPLSDTYAQLIAPTGQAVSDIPVSEVMKALGHLLTHPHSRERVFLS